MFEVNITKKLEWRNLNPKSFLENKKKITAFFKYFLRKNIHSFQSATNKTVVDLYIITFNLISLSWFFFVL